MQDGAPAHTAKKTQTWLSLHIPGIGQKEFDLAIHRIKNFFFLLFVRTNSLEYIYRVVFKSQG